MEKIPTNVVDYVSRYHGNPAAAMERYIKVAEIIREDEVAVRLLEGLIDAATRYLAKVVQMGNRLATARFRLDGDELKALTEDLDRARRFAHEALISDLHIFNRYLVKNYNEDLLDAGIAGGIFPNPDAIRDRIAIGDWAGDLLYGIYTNRTR